MHACVCVCVLWEPCVCCMYVCEYMCLCLLGNHVCAHACVCVCLGTMYAHAYVCVFLGTMCVLMHAFFVLGSYMTSCGVVPQVPFTSLKFFFILLFFLDRISHWPGKAPGIGITSMCHPSWLPLFCKHGFGE